jgi:hypothetical protein
MINTTFTGPFDVPRPAVSSPSSSTRGGRPRIERLPATWRATPAPTTRDDRGDRIDPSLCQVVVRGACVGAFELARDRRVTARVALVLGPGVT